MSELQNKILTVWFAERARWILWLPVFQGAGVGWYFAMENEPQLAVVLPITAALAVGAWAARKKQQFVLAIALFIAFWVTLGVTAGTWRTFSVNAPILDRQLYPQMIEGVVADITTRPDSTRFTLANTKIERLAAERTPRYVTVSLREHADRNIGLGDTIRLQAGFFPPPKPVFPGGYAFNRHFYFKQIGATGYTVGKTQPEILHKATESRGFSGWLARTRLHIAGWLMDKMGPREGAVAAALMVGESKAVPADVYESMRQSGLVHVIAISGMHLTLAAGIFFFATRFFLAAIPAFALRHDGKKVAALVALFGTLAYLLLAGAPISAQRSFVMVALVLGAVMLSRTVTPVRSLCLAASLLLLVTPESLLNPGFQLSFAATLGILAYYEWWKDKKGKVPPEEWTWKQKQRRFWGGIISTSVVATLATTPYILHHFDGLPLYSVLANLLVMPLASFWIMPLVVLVLVLLPFGIAGWFLPLLKAGIAAMLYIADRVFNLPFAVIDLPPLTTQWLALITLGGLWLCLWQTRWRYWGIVAIVGGHASLWFYQPPDIAISEDGKKIALRTAPDTVVMLRGQRNGFVQDGWKRFMRVGEFSLRRHADSKHLSCDELGCIYRWNGQEISISGHRSTLDEDCRSSDMIITPHWSSYFDTRSFCEDALLFDRRWLGKVQGAVFWVTPEGIRYRTVLEVLGNRPWSGR